MGDAAHLFTPFLGQGTNQAIEDALELGRAIGGRTACCWAYAYHAWPSRSALEPMVLCQQARAAAHPLRTCLLVVVSSNHVLLPYLGCQCHSHSKATLLHCRQGLTAQHRRRSTPTRRSECRWPALCRPHPCRQAPTGHTAATETVTKSPARGCC